jgi:hypothetical protein
MLGKSCPDDNVLHRAAGVIDFEAAVHLLTDAHFARRLPAKQHGSGGWERPVSIGVPLIVAAAKLINSALDF